MSRIAVTGAHGFLGWHTRAAALGEGTASTPIRLGDAFDLASAAAALSGAERALHLAGVNRGTDDQVLDGNLALATQFAQALRRADQPPARVVYANSIQAGRPTPYGQAKARAGDVLAEAAAAVGAEFVDLHLPNLYGEHGRPFYNAVTATFCHLLAAGNVPEVHDDKELTLLHVQDAADLLLGTASQPAADLEARETVSGLLRRLTGQADTYRAGEIPDIAGAFDRNLFNTYRSYTFPAQAPIRLTRHADARGSFFEIIRTHGGTSQSSFSTTAPGISRGDHYHRRKVERFTVLAGQATISLRRVFTGERVDFTVTGEEPVAVDMPTLWSHRIVNSGHDMLYTSFWTNDLFNPAEPDTIPEVVQ